MKYMVECHLFEEPVRITHALEAVASQENHDWPEYDLMVQAADYIRMLEHQVQELIDEEDGDLVELKEFEDFWQFLDEL